MRKRLMICCAVALTAGLAMWTCSKNNPTGGGGPAITTQPTNQAVNEGQSASFTVVATGDPTLSYQWQRNDTDIAGATSATYTIASTVDTNSGTYRVIVSNSAGSVTSIGATLVVTPTSPTAPRIATQPKSLTVDEKSSATFTVVATGNPAPLYQWRKNGTDIPGDTSVAITIVSASQADAAIYTVYVWNSQGNVTSTGATLTVTQAPVSQALAYTVSGDTLTITEPRTIFYYSYCNGNTLVTQNDTLGGSFSMLYNISGNTLSLSICDTQLQMCDTVSLTRIGYGTDLIGMWVLLDTSLSDTLVFTATTVTALSSANNNPPTPPSSCYADDWMAFDWSYDSVGFNGTAAELSCTQVRITGNTTGEQVTITWDNNGDMTYTSTDAAHAAYTYYQNPTSCPDDYSPDWYYSYPDGFIYSNQSAPAAAAKRAVRPSVPRIKKHPKFLLFR